MDIQVQDAYRMPKGHGQKRTSPCHIIVKMPRLEKKKKILKVKREKNANLLPKENM
jgi:hypothetical protein